MHPPRPGIWPHPADADAAARLTDRFTALGPTEATLAATQQGAAVLACLGGNSPFLSDLALREPQTLHTALAHGPDAAFAAAMAPLAATPPTTREPTLAATLRIARRRVALAIALADIGGLWPVQRVVQALSDFAEACLRLAVDHLLLAAAARHELTLPDPAHPSQASGFVALGMGKLGASELNYSSDIDLVLIYDPAAQWPHPGPERQRQDAAAVYSRLARALVALLQQRDADGYVHRTDLRLRPDPAATPPAISLPAALTYYESLGQNWERAAMLKARPVAGDITAGLAFLDAIRPFIWRRGLDFAAIADIAAMKRRIDRHRARPSPGALTGFNVKLGSGGIREIEFLAQTLQLVWGGRDPTLRTNTTLGALHALARAGHLPPDAATDLDACYRTLRTIEHRLQMVADRQTHTLPATEQDFARFAIFLDLTAETLAATLTTTLQTVRTRYADVFDAAPDLDEHPALDFSGPDPPPATLAQLAALGFTRPEAIAAAVQGWQAGHVRALRSERARDLIHQVLPALLVALARQHQPDTAFTRLDQLLARLPAGVQPLSLMHRNPALMDRIAAVLGAAPALAGHLARVPQALEGLLAPTAPPPPARLLRERLRDATGPDQSLAIIRRTVHEIGFALAVDTLEATLDADRTGQHRATLADAASPPCCPASSPTPPAASAPCPAAASPSSPSARPARAR